MIRIRAVISRCFLFGLFSVLNLQAGDFYSLKKEFTLPSSQDDVFIKQELSQDGRYIAFYEQAQREELQAAPQHGHFAHSLDIKIWDVQENKLKAALEGHVYPVTGCAFSPDSTKLVSVDIVGEAHLWDIEREVCIDKGDVKESDVGALAFNTSGTAILTGVNNQRVHYSIGVMYLKKALGISNREIRQAHSEKIVSLSARCIEDEEYIFSASLDHSIIQWDSNGEKKQIFVNPAREGHVPGVVNALEVSSDGAFVLASRSLPSQDSVKGLLHLYAEETGRELFSFTDDALMIVHENGQVASTAAHAGPIKALTFSCDNRRIISGSYDKTIKVWNRESGKLIEVLEVCPAPVIALTMTKDDHLVACCSDGTVKIFKDITEQKEAELKKEESKLIGLKVKKDQKEKKYRKDLEEYEAFIKKGQRFSITSSLFASMNEMRFGMKNNLRQYRELYTYTSGKSGDQKIDMIMKRKIEESLLDTIELTNFTLHKLFELSERELLLCGMYGLHNIVIYDRLTGKVLRKLTSPRGLCQGYGDNHVIKGNQLFIRFEQEVFICDLTTGKWIKRLKGQELIQDLALSPAGDLVTCASVWSFDGPRYKLIEWWDTDAGESVRQLQVPNDNICTLKKILPSGKLLFSGYKGLYIVDQQTGNVAAKCDIEGVTHSILIMPDDIIIAASSKGYNADQQGSVASFDSQTGARIQTYNVDVPCAPSVCKLQDGNIAIADSQKTMVWDYITGNEVKRFAYGASSDIMQLRNGDLLLADTNSLTPINLATGQKNEEHSFVWGKRGACKVVFFDDGRCAYACVNGAITIIDTKKEIFLQKFQDSESLCKTEALAIYDNRYIIAAYHSSRGMVKVWDTVENRLISTFYFNQHAERNTDYTVLSIVPLPEGRIALGSKFGIKIYDILTGVELAFHTLRNNNQPRMVLGNDDRLYYAQHSVIMAWDYQKDINNQGRNHIQEVYQNQQFTAMSILSDKRSFVIGAHNGDIAFINLEGHELMRFKGHDNSIYYITSLSGNRILSCAKQSYFLDNLLLTGDVEGKIWDAQTGDCLETFNLKMSGAPQFFENADHELVTLDLDIFRLKSIGSQVELCSMDEVNLIFKCINNPKIDYEQFTDREKSLYDNRESVVKLILDQIIERQEYESEEY